MARNSRVEADLVEAIAACLKRDDVVGGYVDRRIGRVGTYENVPRYLEIGHTSNQPTASTQNEQHLVTLHLWSKSGSAEELREILDAAERVIAASDGGLASIREYSEVRYDDRQASFHGLLRMNITAR